MESDEKKLNADVSGPALSVGTAKDWLKDLEAASGRPVEFRGGMHTSPAGMGGNTEERTVQFRCAETGKQFFVLLTRYSPSHSFQLVSVSKAPETVPVVYRHSASAKADDQRKPFDAAEFDWAGWYCPHCGHKETFVQCGKCREYVCGKRVRRLQDGTATFACHDACGGTGEMAGYIESFNASQQCMSAPKKMLPESTSPTKKQLPWTPKHNLPSGT